MARILLCALSLIVCCAATAGAQVTVTGEVRTSGQFQAWTLLGAIAWAGGFNDVAGVIEIRRRSSGAGPVTTSTPASEYQSQYIVRADLVSRAANDPILLAGDFIVVRRTLELTSPIPAGQFGAGAYRLDSATWGVAAPVVVLTSSEPQYTRAGMVLKLQGTVELEVVVKADGSVGDARVITGFEARLPALLADLRARALGGPDSNHAALVLQIVGDGPIGLDANAIECVRTWTFTPGTILGRPASVIRTVSMPFRLR